MIAEYIFQWVFNSNICEHALTCPKPSPPQKTSFWQKRSHPSASSIGTRDSESDIEPFPISRESFDSYRRSFVSWGELHHTCDSGLIGSYLRTYLRDPLLYLTILDDKVWIPHGYQGYPDLLWTSDASKDNLRQQRRDSRMSDSMTTVPNNLGRRDFFRDLEILQSRLSNHQQLPDSTFQAGREAKVV